MDSVYLALGSNRGARKSNLESALGSLRKNLSITRVSSLYESLPWGGREQENFYNAVVETEMKWDPFCLLDFLKKLEKKMGRHNGEKWGPRVIDLDIVLYGKRIVDLPELKIPHPYLKERIFVLLPLLEINVALVDPVSGKKISSFLPGQSSGNTIAKIAFFDKDKGTWNEAV